MAVKTYKPKTPSRRWITTSSFEEITKTEPEKSLTEGQHRTGGRNNRGRVTSRHRGGGHKQLYRRIDFYRRDKWGMPSTVEAIEYDPNRTARIALLKYQDNEKRYILWPEGLGVGTTVLAHEEAEVKPGNALPLRSIPPGVVIHNLELFKGRGGQLVRSAGNGAIIMAKEGDYAQVKLPSGEIRLVGLDCIATIGQLGNADNKTLSIGKAGRSRWLGRRPHTRGIAMNPHDHPHGGGEGKSGQGNPHPVSPWGWQTKGRRTRNKRKYSSRFIVKRRPNGVRNPQ